LKYGGPERRVWLVLETPLGFGVIRPIRKHDAVGKTRPTVAFLNYNMGNLGISKKTVISWIRSTAVSIE